MNIYGLQKLSLLDYPEHLCATLFTGACNMRCPFCHNSSLVLDYPSIAYINHDYVLNFLDSRKSFLNAVCISGGEPLLNNDIADFIKEVKAMGYKIKLDTNGSFPNKLLELIESKLLDYVAVDIKNSKENYVKTVGLDNFDIGLIDKAINILLKSDIEYEFRTTVVREFHTVKDIEQISIWIKGAHAYYLQNFVNSNNLISNKNMHSVEKSTIIEMLNIAKTRLVNCYLRGI